MGGLSGVLAGSWQSSGFFCRLIKVRHAPVKNQIT